MRVWVSGCGRGMAEGGCGCESVGVEDGGEGEGVRMSITN
jgi:hypothetical protein